MSKFKIKPLGAPKPRKDFYSLSRDGVTQGLIQSVLGCPMKAHLRTREGLSPRGSTGALAFGSLFHEGLDGIYSLCKEMYTNPISHLKGGKNLGGKAVVQRDLGNVDVLVDTVIDRLVVREKKTLQEGTRSAQALQDLEYTQSLVRVMLQAYFKRWESDFADLHWIDIEKTFRVEYLHTIEEGIKPYFTELIPVRGKYDGVFEDRRGDLWLWETKTKSMDVDDEATDKVLAFEIQVMVYLWSMKQVYGRVPKGVIYNTVRRPQLQQRGGRKKDRSDAETWPEFLARVAADVADRPDFYFVRRTVMITPQELTTWEETDLVRMIDQVYRWSQDSTHLRNSGNCRMWNRPCEYLDICSSGNRAAYVKRLSVYPELEETVK